MLSLMMMTFSKGRKNDSGTKLLIKYHSTGLFCCLMEITPSEWMVSIYCRTQKLLRSSGFLVNNSVLHN